MKLAASALLGLIACTAPVIAADSDTLPANQTAVRSGAVPPQAGAADAGARPLDPVATGSQSSPGAGLATNVAPVQNSGTVAPLADQTRQSNPIGRPDPSGLPVVAPTATTGHPQPPSLSSITNPPSNIATAKVIDGMGHAVGAVQTIKVGISGMPEKVDVALAGTDNHVVTLDASTLGYDASSNSLITKSSAEAIHAMPAKS